MANSFDSNHPFFNSISYPWSLSEAIVFHKLLFSLVNNTKRIEMIYLKCADNLPPLNLNVSPDILWYEVLNNLTINNCIKNLCQIIKNDYSNNQQVINIIKLVEEAQYDDKSNKIIQLLKNNPNELLNELSINTINKSNMTKEIKSMVLMTLNKLQSDSDSVTARKLIYKEIGKFNCLLALKYLEKYLNEKPSDLFFEDKYWLSLYISEFKSKKAQNILNSALLREKNEYVKMGLMESIDKLSNYIKQKK